MSNYMNLFESRMSLYTIPASIKKEMKLVDELIDDLEMTTMTKQHLLTHGKTEQGLEIIDAASRFTKVTGVNFSDMSTDLSDMTVALENLAKSIWDGIIALIKGVAKLLAKIFHFVTFGMFKETLMYQARKLDDEKLSSLKSDIPTHGEMSTFISFMQGFCNFLKNFGTFVTTRLSESNCKLDKDDLFELNLIAEKNHSGYFVIRHKQGAEFDDHSDKEHTFSEAGWNASKYNDILKAFSNLDAPYESAKKDMEHTVKQIEHKVEELHQKEKANNGSLPEDSLDYLKYLRELLITTGDVSAAIAKYVNKYIAKFNKIDTHLKKCQVR